MFNPIRVKPFWLRIWFVGSLAWIIGSAWATFPIPPPTSSFEDIESLLQPSTVNLRRACVAYNQSVEVRMHDGSHIICFRNSPEREEYFKSFSRAFVTDARNSRNSHLTRHLLQALGGIGLLTLAMLSAEWIMRGAGKGFLFQGDVHPLGASDNRAPQFGLHFERWRAAVPAIFFVVVLWAALPLMAPWSRMRKVLDAFGPESAGIFFLAGFIVLLYRKALHPVVTISGLLLYTPPAALLFYPLLHSVQMEFLLVPFGVACVEFSRYLGINLPNPAGRHSRFRWQLMIFTLSYIFALFVFGLVISI